MDRDEAYNILYKDGKCNHDKDIVDILWDIVESKIHEPTLWTRNSGRINDNIDLVEIERWNIYNPDIIHIVYEVRINDTQFTNRASSQVKVPISEFAKRYREYQLTELGI